jgi:hypothetical protein
MENFQQFYVEGAEVYIDEIYYYYVNPEERLRLSNILRTELELPAATIEDISTSANEPYYDAQSSYTDTTYDSSIYGQTDVYTPNYSNPYYEEETYTEDYYYEDTYYEEEVYDSAY